MPATKQLFDLAINGDEDAIAYLWKESQTVVVPLARAWSKNKKLRSLYDHEDLVAEIYCAWRKNLDRMQWCGCNQFFAYTKILSQSHCRDLVRSEQAQKRGGEVLIDVPSDFLRRGQSLTARPSKTPSVLMAAEEKKWHMHQAVSLLSDMDKKIILWRRESLSIVEIANRLCVSKRTIARHLAQSLKQVRQSLRESGIIGSSQASR